MPGQGNVHSINGKCIAGTETSHINKFLKYSTILYYSTFIYYVV